MTPEVEEAICEIAEAYPLCGIDKVDDAKAAPSSLSTMFQSLARTRRRATWFGFHINHTYPYADVYPTLCATIFRARRANHSRPRHRWERFETSQRSSSRERPTDTMP